MTSTALITREWNDKTFLFREDGYFNMTKTAKAFGKDVYEYLRLPSTVEYLDALTGKIPDKEFIKTQRGSGLHMTTGTWGHPKVAVPFARWLDVRFAVACDMMIEDILKGSAEVTFVKPEESSFLKYQQELPQMFSELTAVLQQMNKREEAMAAQELTKP